MSEETRTLTLSERSKLSMPLALLLSLVIVTAVSYAAWTSTQERVEAQGRAINELQIKMESTREVLIRIDENVKDLKRTQRAGS